MSYNFTDRNNMVGKTPRQTYFTELQDAVNDLDDKKIDKVEGKGLSTNDYTTTEKNKLAGIATGANNYTHPSTHPASIITQDTNNRFVSDTQILTWNDKQNNLGTGTTSQFLRGDGTWQSVTKSNVSLGSVLNYGLATQAEAESGTSNSKYMTPLRTKQSINKSLAEFVPTLQNYQYTLTAEIEGQQDFLIPLETFNKDTDTAMIAQNRGLLATDDYFVNETSIRLVEGVTIGTSIFLTIFKNVPVEKGSKLIAGDLMAGYYGKVDGLITGTDLSTEVGLTAGTLTHSGDITWLKFSHNYKTLFVADRVIRDTISWDDIQAQNLVKGKTISIESKCFLCRLITVGYSNPAGTLGGEWKELVSSFVSAKTDSNWGIKTWGQEMSSSNIALRRFVGHTSVNSFGADSSYATAGYGWRPVLELL